jgi:hypothetical protein
MFTADEKYIALSESGSAVVLIHDSTCVWYPPHSQNLFTWLNYPNRSSTVLTEAEYGTYHAICNLEQIHITKFSEWANRYDGNSNTNRKEESPRNPIRKLWKSIQNFC